MAESIPKDKKKLNMISRGRTDITLMFVIIFLMVFGTVMVYSSSYYFSLETFGTNSYFFVRQSAWVIIGTVLMYVVSRINHKIWLNLAGIIYLVVNLLLVAVLIVGDEINGSRRWLDLGVIGFQPSEIAKIGIIIVVAAMITAFGKHFGDFKVLMICAFVAIIPVGLVGLENLSTALIMLAIIGGMFIVSYPKVGRMLAVAIPIAGAGIYVLITAFSYRFDRIRIWLDGPFSDPLGDGYQTIQSLYAIGAGGLFGVGLGKSIQKIEFIPEAHNDIIFSIICEELGLFGALSVLLLFALMLWRIVDIIRRNNETASILIAIGVMMHIGSQVFINIGVVTNAIPATGIPLPFVSYGGSSLIFLLAEMGVVLNIARCANHTLEIGE